MHRSIRSVLFVSAVSFLAMECMTTPAMSEGGGPADGFGLHLQAPHMMADGTIDGPYHH